MNRPGTPAADFIYVDRGGSRHRLSDIEAPHILLFFHYPGCGECRRMKAALEASVRYAAADLAGEGIRAFSLSTGPVKTRAASGSAATRLRRSAASL